MKRNLVFLLILALLVVMIAGCSQPATQDETVVIYQNKVEIHEQLTAFAAAYKEATGKEVIVKTSGGDSPYAEALRAEFQSDRQPDIFVIEGMGGYNTWESKLQPYEGDEWIDLTTLEFVVDGKVIGFPVAVEAWGMAYNVDLLEQAGVDPATLRSVVAASRQSEAIEVQYQSLSNPEPRLRWIAPHAIAFDGFRWHARAFCFGDEVFKDFLLSRILDIRGSRASVVMAEDDQDWHTSATLEIGPHRRAARATPSQSEKARWPWR